MMRIYIVLGFFLISSAQASYLLDCEVKARLLEINSTKPYPIEYFRDYDLGEVVKLKIISVTNERSENLATACHKKLQDKIEIGKLRAPLPSEVKHGDMINLSYTFSIPRSPEPKAQVTWEYRK
jgi:hypothetical protein